MYLGAAREPESSWAGRVGEVGARGGGETRAEDGGGAQEWVGRFDTSVSGVFR